MANLEVLGVLTIKAPPKIMLGAKAGNLDLLVKKKIKLKPGSSRKHHKDMKLPHLVYTPPPTQPPPVTTADVYKKGQISIPEGFELTGEFRPAEYGETFLSDGNNVALPGDSWGEPRLILRPKPRPVRIVLEEVGRDRIPTHDEIGFSPGLEACYCYFKDGLDANKPSTIVLRFKEDESEWPGKGE